MKKFLKVVGTLAALAGVLAACAAVYKKYFAPEEDFEEFDEEFEEDFEEDLDAPERGYVSLNAAEASDKEAPQTAEAEADEKETLTEEEKAVEETKTEA